MMRDTQYIVSSQKMLRKEKRSPVGKVLAQCTGSPELRRRHTSEIPAFSGCRRENQEFKVVFLLHSKSGFHCYLKEHLKYVLERREDSCSWSQGIWSMCACTCLGLWQDRAPSSSWKEMARSCTYPLSTYPSEQTSLCKVSPLPGSTISLHTGSWRPSLKYGDLGSIYYLSPRGKEQQAQNAGSHQYIRNS